MHIYYCWITALLSSYQDGIVAGLAKRGYMVGPAAKDGQVSIVQENSPSALVSLSIYKEEEINVNKIYDDVIAVLTEMKAYYHSVIISLSYEATWVGSNVQVPPKPKPVGNPPPVPSGKKKNIN